MKAYPVTVLCAVMRVSRSGFYDYLNRDSSKNNKGSGEAALISRIKEIFVEYKGSCGSRRMVKHLRDEGYEIGRYKVRRIMRQLGLIAKTPKRFKLTTDSKHSLPVAANVLDRKFDVESPNSVRTADISYVWTFEGWLYLAVVMDLHSRQIVGWAMNERMKKQLVMDALAMAYWKRKPPKGLLHHSDRGSQYACHDYQKQLTNYGMIPSMSRKGNCWDNAPTKRFFRSLKSERLTGLRFFSRNEAKNEILDYITFYNSIRLHSTLGYLSPMAYEKEHYLKVA
jgi:transposase InsO family protein